MPSTYTRKSTAHEPLVAASHREATRESSRREQAKDSRRTSIVNAARKLILDTGETGFQMRALADEAGLSLVTPYNLFGSKQAIMIALLAREVGQYETLLMRLRGDALDRLFNAATLARRLYAREPDFHRIVLSAAYQDGGREFRASFRAPRGAFWQRLVITAVDAGMLQDSLPVEPFSSNLAYILLSAILEWVSGEITLLEMEARVHYGFALALLPVVTEAHTERLRQLLVQFTVAVKRWDRGLPDADAEVDNDARLDHTTAPAMVPVAARARARKRNAPASVELEPATLPDTASVTSRAGLATRTARVRRTHRDKPND